MIKEFVDAWDLFSGEIREFFEDDLPRDYTDIVRAVVTMLHAHANVTNKPSPTQIEERVDNSDHGDILYLIGHGTPRNQSNLYYVFVQYGSCSACDTLTSILWQKEKQIIIDDLMSLALHIVQRIKLLEPERLTP